MNNNRIQIGDTVDIRFQHSVEWSWVVKWVPSTIGDVWIFTKDGAVMYVQQFESITKEKP